MVAIGIIAGCGIVISYLLVRLYRQKKEIYDFTEELQRCLTLMKAGEDIGNEAEFKDSLWDKIYQDLQELMDVWNRKNRQRPRVGQQRRKDKRRKKRGALGVEFALSAGNLSTRDRPPVTTHSAHRPSALCVAPIVERR